MEDFRQGRSNVGRITAVPRARRAQVPRDVHEASQFQSIAAQPKKNLRPPVQPLYAGGNAPRDVGTILGVEDCINPVGPGITAIHGNNVQREVSTPNQPSVSSGSVDVGQTVVALEEPVIERGNFKTAIGNQVSAEIQTGDAHIDIVHQAFAILQQIELKLIPIAL